MCFDRLQTGRQIKLTDLVNWPTSIKSLVICKTDRPYKGAKLGEGEGAKLGEGWPKVRLSQDRQSVNLTYLACRSVYQVGQFDCRPVCSRSKHTEPNLRPEKVLQGRSLSSFRCRSKRRFGGICFQLKSVKINSIESFWWKRIFLLFPAILKLNNKYTSTRCFLSTKMP